MITNKIIKDILAIEINGDQNYDSLGLANSQKQNTLSFCDDKKFIASINKNESITGVFTTSEFSKMISDNKNKVICSDPRWAFFTLYNHVEEKKYRKVPTKIDKTATIHHTAHISEYNVVIGKNVSIGPNTMVYPDVEIKDGCTIGSNSVLGCDDVEAKFTSKGLINVFHGGKLVINEYVKIWNSTTIVKGIYDRDTTIGSGSFIANNCDIGHGVQIGENSLLLSACVICGSANVGNNVRVSPGATISNKVNLGDNSEVTLGAVVIKDVKPNEKVSGNFAMEHNKFLYKYIKTFGRI